MTSSLSIEISNPSGLHARPASVFVQTANKFTSEILIQNLTTHSDKVNAKSILSVLTLGITQGNQIEITASGDDAEAAIDALKSQIDSNFGEE